MILFGGANVLYLAAFATGKSVTLRSVAGERRTLKFDAGQLLCETLIDVGPPSFGTVSEGRFESSIATPFFTYETTVYQFRGAPSPYLRVKVFRVDGVEGQLVLLLPAAACAVLLWKGRNRRGNGFPVS